MSVLIYNGVRLDMVKTNSLDRVSRYSPDGSEYLWTDFILDISCVYSPGSTAYPDPFQSGWVTDIEIRSFLMQPRKPFLFYNEEGVPLINITAPTYDDFSVIDCENGPAPISCTVTRIMSQKMFNIRYVIKASIYECPDGTYVSAIASSRYSRTEMINGQDLCVMVTHGVALFRSNVLTLLGQNADDFRGYIIPPCLKGYKRDNITITLDPNGIMLEFTCTDTEQMVDLGGIMLPGTAGSYGIKQMGLVYSSQSLSIGDTGLVGMMALARVEAFAIGNKASAPFTLFSFLYSSAMGKLGQAAKNGMCVECNVREDVFGKSVHLSLAFQLIPPPEAAVPDLTMAVRGYVGEPIITLPKTGGINPQPPFSQGTRGTAAYQLAVGAFATACFTAENQVNIDSTPFVIPVDLMTPAIQPGMVKVLVYPGIDPPQSESKVKKSKVSARAMNGNSDKSGYMSYTIQTQYSTNEGIISVPISSPSGYRSGIYDSQNPDGGGEVTSVDLQVTRATTGKMVSFSIERFGCVPEIPNPKPKDGSRYRLIDRTISPMAIELAPDGYTPIYRVSGTYHYSATGAQKIDNSIPFDIPPWVGIPVSEFTEITKKEYVSGIINNGIVT